MSNVHFYLLSIIINTSTIIINISIIIYKLFFEVN
jgi:hypothetical protein